VIGGSLVQHAGTASVAQIDHAKDGMKRGRDCMTSQKLPPEDKPAQSIRLCVGGFLHVCLYERERKRIVVLIYHSLSFYALN